jgi:hypothetical protein
MAVLTDTDRKALWARFMEDLSRNRELIAVNKADLRATVDAIDSWVDNNQASFNSALPEPAKTNLTAKQKAALLMYVVNKRYEVI